MGRVAVLLQERLECLAKLTGLCQVAGLAMGRGEEVALLARI